MGMIYEVALSLLTLGTAYLVGNKSRLAPVLGLIAEAGWIAWVVTNQHWGLLTLNLSMFVMYMRMYFKWKREN